MIREEVIKNVTAYLEQAKSGQEVENPKVDFKRKWYNLNSKAETNSFLKDTTAIANTVGLDGFIIIGYDPKVDEFQPSTFKECGLKDSSLLNGLISKNVVTYFDFSLYDITIDDHQLSVIHIPPSVDKPHVLKIYQSFDKEGKIKSVEEQRIFVRKNTAIHPATKHDIDFMYYDRKNIIPEYQIICSVAKSELKAYTKANDSYYSGKPNNDYHISCSCTMTLENTGRRPVSITEINMKLSGLEKPAETQLLNLASMQGFTIQSGQLVANKINFKQYVSCEYNYSQVNHIIKSACLEAGAHLRTVKIILSTGKVLECELIISDQ
jgi:hypothetical protein